MTAPKLRVDTPDGPAILVAPLVELIRLRAQHWHGQEIKDLAAGDQREADKSRKVAAALEQLAKDVAEQR